MHPVAEAFIHKGGLPSCCIRMRVEQVFRPAVCRCKSPALAAEMKVLWGTTLSNSFRK